MSSFHIKKNYQNYHIEITENLKESMICQKPGHKNKKIEYVLLLSNVEANFLCFYCLLNDYSDNFKQICLLEDFINKFNNKKKLFVD